MVICHINSMRFYLRAFRTYLGLISSELRFYILN